MSIEIELIAPSYNKKVLNDFLNSAIRKGDLILFINNDKECPPGPLLVEFNEITGGLFINKDRGYPLSHLLTSEGLDSLTFKAEKAISVNNLLEIGGLVFPQGKEEVEEKIKYVPDKFYVGDKKKILYSLKREKLIGYKH